MRIQIVTAALAVILSLSAAAQTPPPAPPAAKPTTPTPQDEALWDAARKGDTAAMRAAIEKGANVNAANRYGATALMFAAGQGRLEAVKLLVEKGADVNAKDTFYGFGVLEAAMMNSHGEVATFLIGAGVKDASGALMMGIQQKNADLVKAAIDAKTVDPKSLAAAVSMAERAGTPEIVALVKAAAAANPVPAATIVEVAPDVLQRYVGTYRNESMGLTVAVTLADGKLVAQPTGQPPLTLMPTSESSFDAVEAPGISTSFTGRGGTVEQMVVSQNNNTFVLPRVVAEAASAAAPAAKAPVDLAALKMPKPKTSPRNWPAFRGANAAGNGDGQGAAVEWDVASGTNVKWKAEIPGIANASPIVWGDRVFVTTAISGSGDNTFKTGLYGDVAPVEDVSAHTWKIYALDKASGKLVWEQTVHTGVPQVKRHTKASQSNSTPATDGTRVVSVFGSIGLLVAHDTATGKELWRKDLGVLDSGWFFDPSYQWGHSSSPIVYKSSVIVQADQQKGSYVAAFDVATGKELWRTAREGEISTWGTPTIFAAEGRDVLVTNGTKIRGYDPVTGKELWSLGPNSEVTVATPVAGTDVVYVTAGYPPVRPVYAIKPTVSGEISLEKGQTAHEALKWSNDREGTYIPTPLLYDGILYTCNNNGILTAYDAQTGERIYRARVGGGGAFSASPVAADGRLYFTSEDGDVFVVKAGREYVEIAKNPMKAVIMSTPAISDGLIVFRTIGHVYAIGARD